MYDSMELRDFIWFLAVGASAGWIATVFAKGKTSGMPGNMAVGILGALCGGFCARQFNITVYGFVEVLGLSVLGAIAFLGFLRTFSRPREAVDRQ